MTNLSVNVNKVALIRNSRKGEVPCIENFSRICIQNGAKGITVHPRPDLRHIRPDDLELLSKVTNELDVEFNIEGNPFSQPNKDFLGFCELVEKIQPDQITLVPDTIDQITSDHGWVPGPHDNKLKHSIELLREKSLGSKISLFVDDVDGVEYAFDMQADLIEIHTGKFSNGIQKNDMSVIEDIQKKL